MIKPIKRLPLNIVLLASLSMGLNACSSDDDTDNPQNPPAEDTETTNDNSPADDNPADPQPNNDPANPSDPPNQLTSIDCSNALPCTWVSEDSGITITFTNFDRMTRSEYNSDLSAYFSIETTRDTNISIVQEGSASYADGDTFSFSRASIGNDVNKEHDFIAAIKVNGQLGFREEPKAYRSTLARYEMAINEANGPKQEIVLLNVPVGRAPSTDAECEFSLPCTWTSDNGDLTVTLTQFARNSRNNHRTDYAFELVASRDMLVQHAYNGRNQLITDNGQVLDYFGGLDVGSDNSFFDDTEHSALSGVPFTASSQFNHLDSEADSLVRFQTSFRESIRIQAFDPVFRNVPIQ